MVTEYITRGGIRLTLGRIPRGIIDGFTAHNRPPQPPKRPPDGDVWGGVDDEDWIEDVSDPAYLAALQKYHVGLFNRQVSLIADAIQVDVCETELSELYKLGMPKTNAKLDYLRFIALGAVQDMAEVTVLVLYNSTVTQRGIDEAIPMFEMDWRGLPVAEWHVDNAPARYNLVFESRIAARKANLTWEQFCEMTGPQQSVEVAVTRLENRLQWLMSNQ